MGWHEELPSLPSFRVEEYRELRVSGFRVVDRILQCNWSLSMTKLHISHARSQGKSFFS